MKTQPLSRKWKPAEKMELNKPSFALKKKVIQQIINGQISIHAAAKTILQIIQNVLKHKKSPY